MFADAHAFNQPLNNWDTSKVTNMENMFYMAEAFNQPLNNWDTSKVTNMKSMFERAHTFNQPLNNRRINQISDENLKSMFHDATVFKTNQPYCNWANWSAKKWNFVNMGLNACINGQCKAYPWNHSSQPATSTANGCVGGDYQDISDDANNWKWKCNGKNGATSTECSASKQPAPINAQCKVYPWNHASQPATDTANACVAGDYQDIADDANNWKWKCIGKYGATSTECSASKQPTPVNGQCKIYPWNHASQPATNSMDGCIAGDYEDITDHSNYWVWKCNGKNGWEAEECGAKQNSIILTSTEPIVACDEWLISSPLTVQWERNELDIDTDGEPMSLRLKFKINFWANWKATDDHWHPNVCRILIKDILSEDNAQKYRRALNKLLDEPSEKIAKTSESGYKLSLYHAVIRWTDLELQLSLGNLYQKLLFQDDHISVTINAYK